MLGFEYDIETIDMRCKNCKFYKEKQDKNYGVCKSGKIKYDYEAGYDDLKSEELDCLIYADAEDYNATHIVGPEFGCVHWKVKE